MPVAGRQHGRAVILAARILVEYVRAHDCEVLREVVRGSKAYAPGVVPLERHGLVVVAWEVEVNPLHARPLRPSQCRSEMEIVQHVVVQTHRQRLRQTDLCRCGAVCGGRSLVDLAVGILDGIVVCGGIGAWERGIVRSRARKNAKSGQPGVYGSLHLRSDGRVVVTFNSRVVVAFDLVRAGINADDAKLKEPYQTDLFADVEVKREDEVQQFQEQKERRAQEAVMKIKARFGKNAILKGNNFEQGATARERNRQIGGHKA